MLDVLLYLVALEVVGFAALPLAAVVFARVPAAGLGFAKPLGLILAVWVTWILGSIGIPYSIPTILLGILAVLATGVLARRAGWGRPRSAESDPALRRELWLWAEGLFVVAFVFMAVLSAFSPDVWFFERPMDMMLISAANLADTFPPDDAWMAGEKVNYYYLGHLVAGWLIRLSAVEPTAGFNLAVAGIFALTATAAFTLVATLWMAARERAGAPARHPAGVGLAAVGLLLIVGNLATPAALIDHDGPLRQFDWFNTTRVIDHPHTITEFPVFSFILGDLHGHVLALPFTILGLGFALQLALAGTEWASRRRAALELAVAAIVVGSLYAINSWSYPVVAGLVVLGLGVWLRDELRARWRAGLVVIAAFGAGSVLAVLPFHLNFDPSAGGIGAVKAREPFDEWMKDTAYTVGLFVWILAAAYVTRLLKTRKPWRNLAWGLSATAFLGAALAAQDLTGPALIALALAAAMGSAFSPWLSVPERFLWVLVAGGATCVLIQDTIYVKDPFDGGPFYRMNTVFKMGFQAWILLALASAPVLAWVASWLPRRARQVWQAGVAALLLVSMTFIFFGTYSRKVAFSVGPRIEGREWLRRAAPGDVRAIDWLRANAKRGEVVLEAVGDDYSAFGHARISVYTGIPTVMGWVSHEIQWAHNPGNRRKEVEDAYQDPEGTQARTLLRRYGIDYVVVGPLERTDYGDAGIAKWDRLGKRVFDAEGTTVWRIRA